MVNFIGLAIGLARTVYLQIYIVHDRIFGGFTAKSPIRTTYNIYIWFRPSLYIV